MKVLLVCGVFPPDVTASALLVDKLLPYFKACGIDVEGLTVKYHFTDADDYTHNGIPVHRANCLLFAPKHMQSVGDFLYRATHRIQKVFQKRKNFFQWDAVWGLVSAMKRLPMEEYDCILGLCVNYSIAVAMEVYKKKYKLRTPMILYQVDPLGEHINYKTIPEVMEHEKALYEIFDHVLTTPTIFRSKQKLQWDTSRVTPLEFPMTLSFRGATEREDREEIKCVYAGLLYGGLRDARRTLELFSQMRDPRIHLYILGKGQADLLHEYAEGPLAGRLHLLGQKAPEICDEILADADILVNIGNTDPYFVPSKLLHYMGFGRPILNVVSCENCPTVPYMEKYGLFRNVNGMTEVSEEEIRQTEQWILAHYEARVSEDAVHSAFADCTPEHITRKIADIIKMQNPVTEESCGK